MPFLVTVLMAIQAGIAPPPVHAGELTKDDLRAIAVVYAHVYDIDAAHFVKTIDCESKFDRNAIGKLGETGIVQIYPKYHTEITREQMLNPVWSMEWAAKQWKAGHQKWWSCYALTAGRPT